MYVNGSQSGSVIHFSNLGWNLINLGVSCLLFKAFIENSVILISTIYVFVQLIQLISNSISYSPFLHYWLLHVNTLERQWGHLPLIQCFKFGFSSKYINIKEIKGIFVTFADCDSFQYSGMNLVWIWFQSSHFIDISTVNWFGYNLTISFKFLLLGTHLST